MLFPDEWKPRLCLEYTLYLPFVSPLWQIIDSGKEKNIGKLEFPLAQLLKSEDMAIEQPFPLKESGHNSTLTCKLMLKVNFPKCFEWYNVWALAVIGVWPVSFNRPLLTLSQHTDTNHFTWLSMWLLVRLLKCPSPMPKNLFLKDSAHPDNHSVWTVVSSCARPFTLHFVPLHSWNYRI